jgi:anaerobic magnesium-protoporphyrin IX monomethyl ester cyclase
VVKKIFEIKSLKQQPNEFLQNDASNSRDMAMLQALQLDIINQKKSQKNTTQIKINHAVTRKIKVALLLLPEWAPYIAPYGLARITSLSRAGGFETMSVDLNAICYSRIDQSYWSGYKDWKWNYEDYYTEIHPLIEPILNEYIEKIVDFKPDVVGFSIYTTSNKATAWAIQEIRKKLPGAVIIAGGPTAIQNKIENTDIIDHVVVGEGEAIFIDLLEKIESNEPITEKFLVHDKNIRIDLDSLPYPDYSDMDLSLYQQRGISAELSRGCVAKCQFCSETTFWRYRGRRASNILDEIEYQYNTLGIQSVWFVDSLVNGNLKELRAFAQGIVDRNIQISWMGYARNDGRMDLDYVTDLRNSGCNMLSFGVESGSQHVLDLIKKNVKRNDIEQNFKDCTSAGIRSHINWFVGFPGERPTDIGETFTLMWRTRNYNILGRSFGTCQIGMDTPLNYEREKFGISYNTLASQWATVDCTNTIFHRLVRYKTGNVLLNHLIKNRSTNYETINERPGLEQPKHYTLTYDPSNIVTDIPYETFDFDVIKIDDHLLVSSLVNEIWPLLRVLWLALGSYNLDLIFDPVHDGPELGTYNLPGGNSFFKARYKFNIDQSGVWTADFSHTVFIDKNNFLSESYQEFKSEFNWSGQGVWARPITSVV